MTNNTPAPSILNDDVIVWAGKSTRIDAQTPIGRLIESAAGEYDWYNNRIVKVANELAQAASRVAIEAASGLGSIRPHGIEHNLFELHASREIKGQEITALLWLLKQETSG